MAQGKNSRFRYILKEKRIDKWFNIGIYTNLTELATSIHKSHKTCWSLLHGKKTGCISKKYKIIKI